MCLQPFSLHFLIKDIFSFHVIPFFTSKYFIDSDFSLVQHSTAE